MPTNPAFASQGRTDHPAALFRMMLAGLAGGPAAVGVTAPAGGVNPTLGARLAPAGLASLAVQIGTGLVYIPNSTAWNGMYAAYNTASANVSLAAVSTTQWRRDLIIALMTDPGDATAAWTLAAVTGTFSSSAPGALPTQPANSVLLAIINVVPNMTVTSGGGTVNDARQFQPLPGPWTTTSSARPSLSAPEGTMWYETDTNLLGVIVNGTYQYIPYGATTADPWHTITPVNGWTASSQTPRYRITQDGELELNGAVSGAAASAGTFFTLPVGWRPATTQTFAAGCTAGVIAGQSSFVQVNPTGTLVGSGITVGTGSQTLAISGRAPLN
jgi:hypothetical protein